MWLEKKETRLEILLEIKKCQAGEMVQRGTNMVYSHMCGKIPMCVRLLKIFEEKLIFVPNLMLYTCKHSKD